MSNIFGSRKGYGSCHVCDSCKTAEEIAACSRGPTCSMKRQTGHTQTLTTECIAMCGTYYQSTRFQSFTKARQACVNRVTGQ